MIAIYISITISEWVFIYKKKNEILYLLMQSHGYYWLSSIPTCQIKWYLICSVFYLWCNKSCFFTPMQRIIINDGSPTLSIMLIVFKFLANMQIDRSFFKSIRNSQKTMKNFIIATALPVSKTLFRLIDQMRRPSCILFLHFKRFRKMALKIIFWMKSTWNSNFFL